MRDKIFYRSIVLHYFDLKYLSAQTHNILKNCYNESASCERTIHYWISKFKFGNISLQDNPRAGQLPKFQDKKLVEFLEKTPNHHRCFERNT